MLRVAGEQLKNNLTRNGVDLAFETDLLYLDVTNNRIGIRTNTPDVELDVEGVIQSQSVQLTDLSTSHQWKSHIDVYGQLQYDYNGVKQFVFTQDKQILNSDGHVLNSLAHLVDVDVVTNNAPYTQSLILISDGNSGYKFAPFTEIPLSSITITDNATVDRVYINGANITTTDGSLTLGSYTSDIILNGDVLVTGQTTSNQNLIVQQQATVGQDLTVTHNVYIGNNAVIGAAITTNELQIGVDSPTTISSIIGDLSFVSATGAVNVSSELYVDGIRSADNTYVMPEEPPTAREGNFWVDSDDGKLSVYYNGSWSEVTGGGNSTAQTFIMDTPPAAPLRGNLWLHSITGKLYIYTNSEWVQPSYELIAGQSSPTIAATWIDENIPTQALDGNLWLNSANGKLYVKVQGQWIQPSMEIAGAGGTGSNTILSDTAPSIANNGDIWMNTSNGRFYFHVDSQWIEPLTSIPGVSTGGSAPTQGTSSTVITALPPPNPVEGDLWIDENTGRMYFYTGSEWVEPASSPPTIDIDIQNYIQILEARITALEQASQ